MLMRIEEKKKHLSIKVKKAPGFEMMLAEEVNTPVPSSIPMLLKGSSLVWYPSVRRVVLSPIKEDEAGLFVNIWRPLFYCELDAGRMKEMTRRYSMTKHYRKKSGVVHTPPRMASLGEALEA